MAKERLSKAEFRAKKQAEFESLVATANSEKASILQRSAARRMLRANERRNDAYNRKNNPSKYAEKLRKKADYYDSKASAMSKKRK